MKELFYFLTAVVVIMTSVTGIVFGFDREMARRDYERYKTSQQEQIVGCLWEYNCKYYNKLLYKGE